MENGSQSETQKLIDFENVNLFQVGQIIWSSKFEIARNVFIVSVLSVLLAFMLPKTYRASGLLMPPTQGEASGLLSSLANLPLGGLMQQSSDETMSSIAILKSRTVMESVVNEFGLVDVYGRKSVEEAVKTLRDNVAFSVEDEGTIKISAYNSTSWLHPDSEEETAKHLSADMVNYFIEQLDIVSKGLKTRQASFHRKFIEGRYNQNIIELREAEDRLKTFQESNRMIALPEQTRVAIEAAATLKGMVLANEVQLGVMKTTLNPTHPDIKRVRYEISELNAQLREMNYGSEAKSADTNNLFPVFSEVPKLGAELMRLTRGVEIQNTIFIYLTQQFEEAKIKEAKDTPTIQVLDYATPLDLKHKPARIRILLIGFVFSTVISTYYVYFRKRWHLST